MAKTTREPAKALRLAVADLNGCARGKRLPAPALDKLLEGGARCPLSVLNLDITGTDIADSPLVFASGDQDGVLRPTGRGPLPMPWLDTPTTLIPAWMFTDDGQPFAGDPRQALARVVDRYTARGWTPVVATELEFYLIDPKDGALHPPASPLTGMTSEGAEILSMDQLDAFDGVLSALYAACDAMGIPADAAIAEGGPGQFEVNLTHQADALKAADDTWLFKLAARGVARQHGLTASFMAKPYDQAAGSGLHVHFSVLDQAGQNIFDNGGPEGTALMRQAVAGCLAAMPVSTLVFAPHANSYDRLVPDAHAPTGIGWGYENRTTALRIPGGPTAARRIEHRVAGGDANPYLMLAVILGAALMGIEDGITPPPPLRGNAYDADLPQIPQRWTDALTVAGVDPTLARLLPPALIDNLLRTKRQEQLILADHDQTALRWLYLDKF